MMLNEYRDNKLKNKMDGKKKKSRSTKYCQRVIERRGWKMVEHTIRYQND